MSLSEKDRLNYYKSLTFIWVLAFVTLVCVNVFFIERHEINKMERKVKAAMVRMEKKDFSDSKNYEEANKMLEEIKKVKKEVTDLEGKFKNRPWME